MNPHITRRSFLKTSTGVAMASPFGINILHAQNKGDKLRLAIIGTGGKGGAHLDCVQTGRRSSSSPIATSTPTARASRRAPGRVPNSIRTTGCCLTRRVKNFDAVMVATPDHSHYQPTALALAAGKHCYTQKPLVHTVWEARQLQLGVLKHKVATQMGNQGHSGEGNRLIYEYVNGGFLGDVTEIHCVTNRPIWPQGGPRPTGEDPGARQRQLGLVARARPPRGPTRTASIMTSNGADSMTSAAVRSPTWPATPWTASSGR